VQRGISRSTALALVLLLAVLVAAAYALRERPADPVASPAAAPTLEFLTEDLYAVAPRRMERTLAITGTLMPRAEATVKARVAGEIAELPVREGQPVRQGQPIGRIDAQDTQTRVNARAADLEAARAQVVLAQKNRATQLALLERRFISQNAFDTTQSSFDVAIARQASAEAELALARKSLGDTRLEAPISGIVAERIAQPGERVAVDARLLRIVDISQLELEAAVPAADITRVRVGQPLVLRADGFDEREFGGRIERINPGAVAGSRAINIYAVIANPDGLLRAGTFVRGAVSLDSDAPVPAIPASAVRDELGTTYVYVIEGSMLKKRSVRTGPADAAAMVPVIAGLAAGERVVRANLGTLREGSQVRVVQMAGPKR
jgi:membrane fusion protein (multidrug efflux system)